MQSCAQRDLTWERLHEAKVKPPILKNMHANDCRWCGAWNMVTQCHIVVQAGATLGAVPSALTEVQ